MLAAQMVVKISARAKEMIVLEGSVVAKGLKKWWRLNGHFRRRIIIHSKN